MNLDPAVGARHYAIPGQFFFSELNYVAAGKLEFRI
jgi:hypothetical protein